MMKIFKGILTGTVFFILLLALLIGFNNLLEFKDSRAKIAPMLKRAGQIDVLFLGDSHAYSDIYPFELWDRYGITAYNLGNYNCTIPLSYWVMRNALDKCSPRVVVVDVNLVWEQLKLPGNSSDVHLSLDGFPLSRTKLDTLFDLMDDPAVTDNNGNSYPDLIPEFIFPLIKYHARWIDLVRGKPAPLHNRELGGERNLEVATPSSYEILDDAAPEQGFGFIYLRRLIEYCQGKDIRVLLVNLPYPSRNENDEQLYTNAVQYLADEYSVEYLDFVYMDQIVDYSTDCYDPDSHMNPSGAWKVTGFLGEHLRSQYDVPDHREDAAYTEWHTDYDLYCRDKLQSLREAEEPRIFLMLLSDPSFSTVLILPENSSIRGNAHAMQLLQNAGRRHLKHADMYSAVWSDSLMPLQQVSQTGGGAYMAFIDRSGPNPTVTECVGNGTLSGPFGSLSLDSDAGTVTVQGKHDSQVLSIDRDADLIAAMLDKETGQILYERPLNYDHGSHHQKHHQK
ncbi:MAG: hypothetical protein IJ088_09300 [Clostridia bacterium]|nr:hypothetical protein [Clostridia bacterium]